MSKIIDYIKYEYLDSEVTSLSKFINGNLSLMESYKGRIKDLLLYKDEKGKSNKDRIWETYTISEKKIFHEAYDKNELDFIKVGTIIAIPKSEIKNEVAAIQGKDLFTKSTSFLGFWQEKLLEFINNPLNKPVQELTSNSSQLNLNCSVWIWVRSLNKILNVSQFISTLNTTVEGQVGSFNLELSSFENLSDVINLGDDIISDFQIGSFQDKDDIKKEKIPFFMKYLQQNDIVFIRFEQLELEQESRKFSESSFEIGKDQLPDKPENGDRKRRFYDMIGLIDTVSESTSHLSSESDISIVGRDLMKLLIEDSNYFFPLMFVENSTNLFVNLDESNKWFKRSFATNKYEYVFSYSLRSIKDTLSFVINQLSNLGILPNNVDLFSAYGDDRSKVYELTNGSKEYYNYVESNGIWQIINLSIDDALSNRMLADSSITKPDGPILSQFNKICQEPFVEFWGDTYGDKYVFNVRQPPFTKKAITDFLDTNEIITITDYESKNLVWEDNFFTWYQLTPRGSYLGAESKIALAYLPVVYFPQFADMFGNHSMNVESNYSSRRALFGLKDKDNVNQYRQAAIEDLVYMIECNAYLPFTRKGSIVLPYGDRRIKRGTFIRFAPTSEIFYVDSVTNSLANFDNNVERTTTINVSRGMVEKLIKGIPPSSVTASSKQNIDLSLPLEEIGTTLSGVNLLGEVTVKPSSAGNISYFSIVDTDLIRTTLIERSIPKGDDSNPIIKLKKSTKTNFGVNENSFNFFVNRNQFNV